MNKEIKEKIENFMEELNADSYRKGEDWNGNEVYVPEYSQPVYIGLPYVVLVKEKNVRLSTEEESLDYLSYSHQVKALNSNVENLKTEQAEKLD